MNITKKIFLILALLALVYSNVRAQVTIKFEHAKDRELVGVVDLMDLYNRKVNSVRDGELSLSLELDKKSLVSFGYDGDVYFIFTQPKQEFVFDCKKKICLGGDEKLNSFLADWKVKYYKNPLNAWLFQQMSHNTFQNKKTNSPNLNMYATPNFLSDFSKMHNKQIKMLKTSKIKDEDFKEMFAEFLDLSYWNTIIGSVVVLRSKMIDVPECLLDEVLKLDLYETGFLEKSYANQRLKAYVAALKDKGQLKGTLTDYVYKTASLFKTEELREYFILNDIKKKIEHKNLVYFEELYSSARPLVTTLEGKKNFEELYAKGKSMIEKSPFDGVKSKELIFFTSDGKEVALSDYIGKYVYIDIWATWCGPCKQEAPHFFNLAESMKDENIVFLSLSVDQQSSEEKWKEYIKKHNVEKNCVAGWTGAGVNNTFIKHYQVKGIPRFMLIGPDGTMLYSNFWRPSNAHINELLSSFLK